MQVEPRDGQARGGGDGAGLDASSVEDAVAACIDRLTRGEKIDRLQILLEHPGIGHEILECLEQFVELDGPPAPLPREGRFGDYTVLREVGRGGMGVVYEARQNSMDRRVALKVLPAGAALDRNAFLRFLREAQVAGKLQHPSIVPVYAMGVEGCTPYYTMQYIDGETLARTIARMREGGANPPLAPFGEGEVDLGYFVAVAKAFADVADGLQHAHREGVIHRDIKPSNLIVDSERRLRILDFGLAQLEGPGTITLPGDVLGTPLYMSPEQAKREKIPVDHRTDIYSLGATLYELLTLQAPFRGKDYQDTLSQILSREPTPPHRLSSRIPRDLETIVLKCLRKDPADRYGTAEALAQDLRRFARGEMIEARPPGTWERFALHVRRHRVKLLIVAAFLILGSAAGWFAYRSARAERERLRAECNAAVFEAAVTLAAGQFSLQPGPTVPGSMGPLGVPIALVPPEELRKVLVTHGERPVHEAVLKLEAITMALPGERDAHYQLARAYRLLGKPERARAEARLTLQIDSGFVPAEALVRELDGELPTTGHDVVLENMADPPAEETWQHSWREAHDAAGRGDWPNALKAYDQLIALSEGGEEPYSGFPLEAYLARGAARLSRGNCEGAQEDFAVARFLAPDALEATLLLGRVYFLEGRPELTEDHLQRVYGGTTETRRDETALWSATLYISLGDYRNALAWAERLGRPSIRERVRTYLLLRLEDWDGAIDAGRSAVAAEPENLLSRSLFATALLRGIALRPPSSGDEPDARALELVDVAQGAVDFDAGSAHAHELLRVAQETLRLAWNEFLRRKDMIIRRDRATTRWIAALALAAGPTALAGGEVCDDFLDGDAFDGDFIAWRMSPAYPAQVTYDACGLKVLDTGPQAGGLVSQEVFAGDVCARLRYSLNGAPAAVYLGLPITNVDAPAIISGYGVRVDYRGAYKVYRLDNGAFGLEVNGPLPPDFDPTLPNRVIELRTTGEYVEFRAWPADGQRPETPTFSISDNRYRVGTVLWGVYTSPRTQPTCFHEVCIGCGSAPIEPVTDLTCSSPSCKEFALTWVNGQAYDAIVVALDGETLETLGGDRTSCEGSLPAGAYAFSVTGVYEETESEAESCSVRIERCLEFRRGDANADGETNIADAVFVLSHLFASGAAPSCRDAGDGNDDEKIDIADAVAVLSHLFAGTGPLSEPFTACGADPTHDELDCASFPPCEGP